MKPNILFILIDSLREDKCYGLSKTSQTPNINSLLNKGVYFTQTISSAAATAVAVSSIFTSLYPFKTGMGGETYSTLNSNIPNFVKIFKDAGYNTYATAPEIASDFGLTCDFQNVDVSYNNYFSLFAGLGEQILERISSNQLEKPWFFYIHLFDLHTPVVVPQEFDNEEFGLSQYERMVSAIDSWIGNVLEKINLNETLIVITSDHGEYVPILNVDGKLINLEPSPTETNLWKLGNKVPSNLYPIKRKFGSMLRGARGKLKSSKIDSMSLSPYEKRILLDSRMGSGHRLYDDLIRVPLIFSGFGIDKPSIISQQVRHVDIFPTIAEIIGVDFKIDTDGVSVLPLIKGESMKEVPAYIESPPGIEKKQTKIIGIRTSKHKFIRSLEEPIKIKELFDLKNDPLEENNIAEQKSDIIDYFENQISNTRTNPNLQLNTDEDEIRIIEEKLKKLGYT
jgi:arylsulfatase A-like enzyme